MEYKDYLQMSDDELNEIIDEGSDADSSGRACLEMAHRWLQRGDRNAYLNYLDAAIENGNPEAADEKEQASEEKKQGIQQKEQAFLDRIEEIGNGKTSERINLAKNGDLCAMVVNFDQKLSRKQISDAYIVLLTLVNHIAEAGFSKAFMDKLLGERWFKLAQAYDRTNGNKALECYKQAAEFNHLETLRLFQAGEISGDYDAIAFRNRLSELGNSTDKYHALVANLSDGRAEDVDGTVLKLLNANDVPPEQYYEWANKLLSFHQIDSACMLYEQITETAPETSVYSLLSLFMLKGIDGKDADYLFEMIIPILEKEYALVCDAMERLISYALEMEDVPFTAEIKGIYDRKISCMILSRQEESESSSEKPTQKLFLDLSLADLMPERIMETYDNAPYALACLTSHDEEAGAESFAYLDGDKHPVSQEIATLYLECDLRYLDDKGSFVMLAEDKDTYILCTVLSEKQAQDDDTEKRVSATVYLGPLVNHKPEGNGTIWYYKKDKYCDAFLPISLLAPDKILNTLREQPAQYKYEGHFADGETNGQGKLTHQNGRQWIGKFIKGATPHGKTIFIGISGDYFICGNYSHGNLVGSNISTILKITEKNEENTSAAGWTYAGETVCIEGYSTSQDKGIYVMFQDLPSDMVNIDYIQDHIDDIPYTKKKKGIFEKDYILKSGTIEEKLDSCNVCYDGEWENGRFKAGIKLTTTKESDSNSDQILSGTLLIKNAVGEQNTGKVLCFKDVPAAMLDRQNLSNQYETLPYQWKYEGEIGDKGPRGSGVLTYPDCDPCKGTFIQYGDRIIHMLQDSFADAELTIAKKPGKGMELRLTETGPELYVGKYENGKWNDPEGFWGIPDESAENLTYEALSKERDGQAGYLLLKYKEQYIGQFTDGERTGTGLKTDNHGNCWKGTFVNGEIDGEGTWINIAQDYEPNWFITNSYKGLFSNGFSEGSGCYISCKKWSSVDETRSVASSIDYVWDHLDEYPQRLTRKGYFTKDYHLKGEGKESILTTCFKQYSKGIWDIDQYGSVQTSGLRLYVHKQNADDHAVSGAMLVLSSYQPDTGLYLGKIKHFTGVSESSIDDQKGPEQYDALPFDWCFEGEMSIPHVQYPIEYDCVPGKKGKFTFASGHHSYQVLLAFMKDYPSENTIMITINDIKKMDESDSSTHATIHYPDGSVYTGTINRDYVPDGQGRLQKGDLVYSGGFINGQRSGHGQLSSKEKKIYDGVWKDDHITEKISMLQRKWKAYL